MKATRQGVRDLDAIGKKPRRGHVGRPVDVDRSVCFHEWEARCTGLCDYYMTCTCGDRCRRCGEVRE